MNLITFPHIGIILIISGTVLLSFTVSYETKYTLTARNKKEKEYWKRIVGEIKDGNSFEPRLPVIRKKTLYGGLFLVAIGTLFQW